jgi:chemotaxis protein MotB
MSTPRLTCILALFLFSAACVSPEEHRKLQSANQALQTQLDQLKEHQKGLAQENDMLKADLVRLGKTAADAEWVKAQKEKLDELLKRYGDGTGTSMPGVEVIQTGEGVAFRVLGGVLFSSGKADITDQGKKTLQPLIATLKGEGKRIRVDGHTDDEPITHSSWGTNLRLSVERSLAVAAFLIQSGVPADRVGVAGFGEYRPSKQGSTEDARAANRRVEILMLDR